MNNNTTNTEEKAVSLWARKIKWSVNMSDVLAQLDKMSIMDISQTLSLPLAKCVKMTPAEIKEAAQKCCEKNPELRARIMNLPSEVKIPDEFYNRDNVNDDVDVLDWFEEEYSFLVSDFFPEREMSKERMRTLLDAMIDDHANSIASQAECIKYLMDNCGFSIDDLMFFGYSHDDICTAMGK